jgi:uncharacterized protein TIGR03905
MAIEHIEYRPSGVCTQWMEFDVENGKLLRYQSVGGCNGNSKGVKNLIEGMEIDTIIDKLDGVICDGKCSSCPDQIATALKQYRDSKVNIARG